MAVLKSGPGPGGAVAAGGVWAGWPKAKPAAARTASAARARAAGFVLTRLAASPLTTPCKETTEYSPELSGARGRRRRAVPVKLDERRPANSSSSFVYLVLLSSQMKSPRTYRMKARAAAAEATRER